MANRCEQSELRSMKEFFRPNNRLTRKWTWFWIKRGSLSCFGRFAMGLSAMFTAPHKARVGLAFLNDFGFIDRSVIIDHDELILGKNIFIDQRAILFKRGGTGSIELKNKVAIYREVFIESGWGGTVLIDEKASIHPRCQINAFISSIHIGKNVMLAPFCALYAYDHGLKKGEPILTQPLTSKGPIRIGDNAWLGVSAIVTSGVTIGDGAVVGAGSVVTKDIPPNAIAAGNPAKVVGFRK
jgi:acetyltransferase-like isoleucine patch superfamily enzyme